MNTMSPKFSGLVAAFDAGATNTRFCLVDDQRLRVVSPIQKMPTPNNRADFERLIQASVGLLEQAGGKAVDSVALAIAGRVDPAKGQVLGVNNGAFSATGKPLGQALAGALKKPVFL